MKAVERDWSALGAAVMARRIELGIPTQRDAAERANVHVNTWNAVENGRAVRMRSLEAMSEVLHWRLSTMTAVLRGGSVDDGPEQAVQGRSSDEPGPVEFGDKVRRQRLSYGWTQQDLAEIAGVSRGTIRNVEAGVAPPFARTVGLIEDALLGRINGSSPEVDGPALVFVASDGSRSQVDGDRWNVSDLGPRDQAILKALLTYALSRLPEPGVPEPPTTTPEETPNHG